MNPELAAKIRRILNATAGAEAELKNEAPETRARIEAELSGLGPLAALLADAGVTEILVNSHRDIYYEKDGSLTRLPDRFFSEASFAAALERLSQACGSYLNRDKPFLEARLPEGRLTLIFGEIARGTPLLSLRRQPAARWTLQAFSETGFLTPPEAAQMRTLFEERLNILVVGGTGTGKTSFLQALLELSPPDLRHVIIEDTQELQLPNAASVSLLTRQDPSRSVPDVTLEDLLKRALRLRPDRLVVGEIRGAEATTLLLALSAGHAGSLGSLHAGSAEEALIRLEMLVQMGAPQWSLQAVRRLMAMTIHRIVVLEKENKKRRLKGVFKIDSMEETGLTLSQL